MIDDEIAAELTRSFTAALATATDAEAADAALVELGWHDLLAHMPRPGAALAFGAAGTCGAAATLLDDLVVAACGQTPSADFAAMFPMAASIEPPGTVGDDGVVTLNGIVSARTGRAKEVIIATRSSSGTAMIVAATWHIAVEAGAALDPGATFLRATGRLQPDEYRHLAVDGDGQRWAAAVAAARLALAAELVGASRRMLEQARQHAVDRHQFGGRVASFQAVRHKLAESLAAIEGADDVTVAAAATDDPLLDALAKSLAGAAARTTAVHAQQVLAGIGFTIEHPFHLTLKRVMILDSLFGSAATIPTELGRELLRRGTVPRLVEL